MSRLNGRRLAVGVPPVPARAGGTPPPVSPPSCHRLTGGDELAAPPPAVKTRNTGQLLLNPQNFAPLLALSVIPLMLAAATLGGQAQNENTVQARRDPLTPLDLAKVKVGGEIGRRLDVTATNNVLRLDVDGVFLASFEKKNDPHNHYVALGKLIDAVVKLSCYTRNPSLISLKEHLIRRIIEWQEADGYIGNMIPASRMGQVWDIHELNYIVWGLLTDYKLFGEQRSLVAARKAADYILNHWSKIPADWEKTTRIAAFVSVTGLDRTMLALYGVTGDRRYLGFELNQRGLENWDPGIVIGRRPLVEGHTYAYLAACLAQLELYRIKPEEKLLGPTMKALEFLTAKEGMTITGGVGQAEIWTDDQDGGRDHAETCSTAYQIRVYESLLRLQGDARYGDLMERTLFNTLFGAQSPDGRQIRYFTPFEGERVYNRADDVCCPGNYRRIIAELPTMVYYRAGKGVAINLYSAYNATLAMEGGLSIAVQQETDYPNSGHVLIRVDPSQPASFPLKLRIPSWSKRATISVNGKPSETACVAGTFAVIERRWNTGDQVVLDMPMEWRLVQGRQRQAGRAAVMRGPLVFCLDPGQDKSLAQKDAADLGRIMIDLASIEPNPVPSNAVRPDGIGCRLKAGTFPGAMGNEGDVRLTLTEFADPNGRACYFRVPDLSKTEADELTGLWK